MAFKRENIENSYSKTGLTSSPLDNEKKMGSSLHYTTKWGLQNGVKSTVDPWQGNCIKIWHGF